ncbi:MAG TPA: PQQ-binding-like beta-propeller repeat protein [Candidatus Sulfotelmatobacter sp.]|nr:PQQ-binding-like beta-propeller repeat protein [Candidatus Sulfotelmatobacter sp.]
MKNSNKMAKITAITVTVIMIASTILLALPAQAQSTLPAGVTPTNLQDGGSTLLPSGVTPDLQLDSTVYLSFSPNPIGLGQPLLVNLWMQPPVHVSRQLKGFSVTFTKPDGTKDIISPIDSYKGDATAWFTYPVDQVGTWKIKLDFPGAFFPAGNYTVPEGTFMGTQTVSFTQSCYYKPASTEEQLLTVQQDMVMSWPPAALPTDYWTRPISPENREWWPIAGNYPSTGILGGGDTNTNLYMSNYNFVPYVQTRNTAHIAWKRQGSDSGLIGGMEGQKSLSGGGGNPSVIYQGRCYQTVTRIMNGSPTSVWECYDLRTGQVYWDQPVPLAVTQTQFGPTVQPPAAAPNIVLYEEIWTGTSAAGTAANIGGLSVSLLYVGNGRWIKFDPITGAVTQNVSISPLTTGTCYKNNFFLTVQNLGNNVPANQRYRLINWTVTGPVGAGSAGYRVNYSMTVMNNITWPWSSLPSTTDYEAGISAQISGTTSPITGVTNGTAISAASLTTGQVLWTTTSTGLQYSGACAAADHGKVAVLMEKGVYEAYDLTTGSLAWKSEAMAYPWGGSSFGAYAVQSAYGLLYRESYDGVYAFDWKDGRIVWHFKAPTPYAFETPYATENETGYSFNSGGIVADGKLFTFNTEHTPSQPITRGWRLFCINATSGKGIWNITGSASPGGVADGYLTASNSYDGYMYVFGKGKSKTTLEAPLTAIPKGQGVLIQGTVLDQSPAQPDTPCISKESMTIYMEYLHMQKPIPNGYVVTGVPVTLMAVDANGSVTQIGTVATDVSGSFKTSWTPPAEGLYTITASFTGDDSYGSSWAETGLSVGLAVEQSNNNSNVQQTIPDYTMTIIYAAIAIIVAVAIVGALIVLALRKR